VTILEQYLLGGGTAREIAARVEAAVRGGALAPGDKLPTVRSLAADLRVSPATVAAAYAQLGRRGLVTGSGRGGTRVRPAPPVTARGYPRAPGGTRDLISGAPDPALLPALPAASPERSRLYPDVQVAPRLGELAARQLRADGVDASNLAVTGGALDAIERVLTGWLMPGDRVAVEDPGHAVTYDLLAAMGLTTVPVPVDDYGMLPAELERALHSGVSAIIVTPRAQAATGAAWDARRAGELAGALRGFPAAGLIEDDHAGPVAGVAGHSLAGPSARSRWAHVRSVSKSLGPDLRVALVAGDETTISRLSGRQMLGTGWVSYQLQDMVAAMWSDPAPVAAAAAEYGRRRVALREALAARGITVGARSGFTCWVPVSDEGSVVAELAASGWAVAPGARFRIAAAPGIRLCYATMRPDEAARFAADLAAALRATPRRAD
jgi:DNA-binding transcriptional MocR family regulator